jgi:hypothetical protein
LIILITIVFGEIIMFKTQARFMVVLFLSVFLGACGPSMVRKVDNGELNKIKSVAVILYTIPTNIAYRSDPRKKESAGLFSAVMQAASGKIPSKEAATISHKTFIEALNSHKLSFKVLSHEQLFANKEFVALAKSKSKSKNEKGEEKKEEKEGFFGATLGFLLGGSSTSTEGDGPDGLPSFGVSEWGKTSSALQGVKGEREYVLAAIQALNVDAAIIVADSGYAFSCEVCIGVTGSMNGAASTSSAFFVTMLNRSGSVVLNLQEWFASTDAQAVMVSSAVNPLQHKSLFEEHGRKMASVFVDSLHEGMKKKK